MWRSVVVRELFAGVLSRKARQKQGGGHTRMCMVREDERLPRRVR